MKKKRILIVQVATTYIGTVVGAGFASGQSIMRFFTVYGSWGTIGILINTFLFAWIGTKMMLVSHRIRGSSYQELNYYLFGKVFGKAANILTFIILFGVTSVMLSGIGSIFKEQLGLPYQLGILSSIGLSYLVMTKEIKGIIAINVLVVPMLLLFTSLLAFKLVEMNGLSLFQTMEWKYNPSHNLKWLIDSLAYVSLNLVFVQAVMVPLGSEAEDESTLIWGGLLGGIGLGFMLLVIHFAIQLRMPEMLRFEIPMAEIIKGFGWYMHVLFLMVIYGEILTSLIGNVFGITRQIQSMYNVPVKGIVLIVLLACFLISQAGFVSLVQYLYPLFGYFGMVILIVLWFRRLN